MHPFIINNEKLTNIIPFFFPGGLRGKINDGWHPNWVLPREMCIDKIRFFKLPSIIRNKKGGQ
jgi:hypothetical protein